MRRLAHKNKPLQRSTSSSHSLDHSIDLSIDRVNVKIPFLSFFGHSSQKLERAKKEKASRSTCTVCVRNERGDMTSGTNGVFFRRPENDLPRPSPRPSPPSCAELGVRVEREWHDRAERRPLQRQHGRREWGVLLRVGPGGGQRRHRDAKKSRENGRLHL